MKRRFTILTAALALLAFLAIPMGVWGQTRAEVVTYTLDGTEIVGNAAPYNAYASYSPVEQDEINWQVMANTTMNPWRIGGKNLTNEERPVYSTEPIPGNITKIVVEHGTASNITVNSWTVIVASDANFANVVSTLTPTFTASSSTTINRPSGTDWTGCYYKFVYNVSVSGSNNRFVQFVKAEFYKQEGATPTCATPTFSPAAGTYTEAQNVSINCSTEGATIYYTTNGDNPTTNSTVYTAAINVSSDMTIKAMATAEGYDNSAIATAAYTIVNIEHAGTEADPYTVADARAAIDANVGVTGVYATGIVSEIVTAYNSTYGNITFDIVDEVGNSATLRAYRCGGTEAANVAVNDIVVVYGNLTKYGSTYEFGQDCEVVSLTHPSSTEPSITVTPMTVNAPAEGKDGNFNVTCDNVGNPYVLDVTYYASDGLALSPDASPDWISYGNLDTENATSIDYYIDANTGAARTAYLKIQCFVNGAPIVESGLITISQAEYVAPTYAELPFAFNSGKADIESTDGFYQEGLGDDYNANNNPNTQLKFDGTGDWLLLQFNERPGTLTFDIKGNSFSGGTFSLQTSEDGVTFTTLKNYTNNNFGDNVYSEAVNNVEENVRYIKWVYTEKSSGNVGLGNIVLAKYAEEEHTITLSPELIEVGAEGGEGGLEYIVNWDNGGWATGFQFYDAQGEAVDQPNWITIVQQIGENEDYHYTIAANEGEARSAYFKAYTDDEGTTLYSNLVTVNQAAAGPVVDYAELPFEWEGGASADFLALNGVTAEGLGSDYASGNAPYLIKFDGTGDYIQVKCDQQPGKVTIGVKMIGGANTSTITIQGSADGETFTDIQELTISGVQNDVLTLETTTGFAANDRYVRMLFTKGSNVGVGPITIAVPSTEPSITVNPMTVEAPAEGVDGSFTVTCANVGDSYELDVMYYTSDGAALNPGEYPLWFGFSNLNIENATSIGYSIDANDGAARTAYIKIQCMVNGAPIVESGLITISQAAYVAPPTPGSKYVQVTSTADLTSGQYLIVYEEGPVAFDGSLETLDAAGNTIDVTIQDDEIAVTTETAAAEFTIDMAAGTIMSASGYYIGRTGDSNGMNASQEEAYENTISIDDEGNAVVVASGGAYLRYNATSGQDRFRYFKSSTYSAQEAIQLYKKVAEPITETHKLTINGYTSNDNGWYLIASPVSTTPSEVTDMLSNTYDLYRFNPTADLEWENYQNQDHQSEFNIVPGQGYLYANSNTVELSFTGTPYSGDGTITLANAGWNLVGNPFGFEAIITDKDCYTINDEHTGIMPEISTRNIAVMEGVFVQASAAGETVTFSRPAKSNDNRSAVVLNLSQGRGTIDRAIVRFGSSSTLPKFQLFENSTKLYIAQNGEDFAIVNADNQGEMPVSFKANKNGQYTITVNAEGVEMNYLHLIDNMTGADVDLLQTPSYSFEAKTTDYESRFRLVFSNESASEANFAYFNGSEWVVNGNGTLQVIDVMGRILSSQNVDGSVNVNAAPGVYMIRLINGDNVKTQKVVVR